MKNKTKILSSLTTAIIGAGAIATPVIVSSSCSKSSMVDLRKFDMPLARMSEETLIERFGPSYTESDVLTQYIEDINNDNSILINDLYWNQAKKVRAASGFNTDIKKANMLITDFTIDSISGEVSLNLKLQQHIVRTGNSKGPVEDRISFGSLSPIKETKGEFDISFSNIPINIFPNGAFEELDITKWDLATEIFDSTEAENNQNWKITVNNWNIETIFTDKTKVSEDFSGTEFNYNNLYSTEANGSEISYYACLNWILINDITYLFEIQDIALAFYR